MITAKQANEISKRKINSHPNLLIDDIFKSIRFEAEKGETELNYYTDSILLDSDIRTLKILKYQVYQNSKFIKINW